MRKFLIPIIVILGTIIACRSTGTPLVPTSVPVATTSSQPAPTETQNPDGDSSSLWYLTRGDTKSDQAWGIDTDSNGNIYAAAYMQQPASRPFFDMVIYKFSPDGNEIWQTQWGGQYQEKAFIVVVDEPVVYVGGLRHTTIDINEADMALLALDMETGTILWEFTWGEAGYEELDGLIVDGDFLYISGWTYDEKTSEDMAVLKLDKQGNLVWSTTWGHEGFDEGDGQIVVDDQYIYVCGRVNGNSILTGGDAGLVKFSKEDGSLVDTTTWGGALFDDALGMTSDGESLYLVGLTLSKGSGGQIFLLKYDKDLNLGWEQIWGGPKGESARVAEVDTEDNVLVAGATDSYGVGMNDVVLLKYSPDGQLIWSRTWGGPATDVIHGMEIAGDFVYLAGHTESFSRGMQDSLIIKADRIDGEFPDIKE